MLGLPAGRPSRNDCGDAHDDRFGQIGTRAGLPAESDPLCARCERAARMSPTPAPRPAPAEDTASQAAPSPCVVASEEAQAAGGVTATRPRKFFPLFSREQTPAQDDTSGLAAVSDTTGKPTSPKIPADTNRPQQQPGTTVLEAHQGQLRNDRPQDHEEDARGKLSVMLSEKAMNFFAPRRPQRACSPSASWQQFADVRPVCSAPWPGSSGVPNTHVRQLGEGAAANQSPSSDSQRKVRGQSGYWPLRSEGVRISVLPSNPSVWRPSPEVERPVAQNVVRLPPCDDRYLNVSELLLQFDETFADSHSDFLRPCAALRKRLLEGFASTGEASEANAAAEHNLLDVYYPHSVNDVLGSQSRANAQSLADWLKQWAITPPGEPTDGRDPSVKLPKKTGKKQKRKTKERPDSLDGFIVDVSGAECSSSSVEDDDGRTRPLPVMVLVGPSGSGKTSAVHAAARDTGYDVFEVHPGMRRSAKDLLTLVGEVTQNHVMAGWDVREEEQFLPGAESENARPKIAREHCVTVATDVSTDGSTATTELFERRDRKRKKGQRRTPLPQNEADSATVTRNKCFWEKMGFTRASPKPIFSTVPSSGGTESSSSCSPVPVPAELPIILAESDAPELTPDAEDGNLPQPAESELMVKVQRLVASSSAKPLLILLEEADITYEEDQTFWKAVATLAERNRRPIVITCNTLDGLDHYLISEYIYATLTFEPVPRVEMIPYLYMLSLCEGIVPRRDQLNDLCRIWHDDIRRILRELAFWGRRAARDGLEDGSATREGDPPRKVIGPDRSIGAGLPPLSNILLGSPEYALGVVDRWPASYCIELPATLDIAPTDLLGDWADSLPQPLRCSQPVPTTTSDSPDRVELIPQPTLAALPGLAPGISCRLETDPCFASVKLNPGGAASVVAATRIFTASNHPDTLLGFIDAYVELISFTDAYVGVKQWRKEQIHGMDSYEAGVSDRSSRPKTLHKQSLPGTMARRSGAPDHSDVDVQITWLLSLGARRQLDRHAGPNPPLEGPSVDVVAGNIADAIARKDSKASRTEAAREAAWFTLQELGVARCTGLRGGAEATSRNPAVVKVLGPLLATASAMRTGVDFYPQMVYYAGLIARIDRRMADELTGDMSRRRRNGRMPPVLRHFLEDLQDFEQADASLRFAAHIPGANSRLFQNL